MLVSCFTAIKLRRKHSIYKNYSTKYGVVSIEKLIRRFVKNAVILSLGEATANSQWLQPLE